MLNIDFYTDLLKRPSAEPQHTLYEKKEIYEYDDSSPRMCQDILDVSTKTAILLLDLFQAV